MSVAILAQVKECRTCKRSLPLNAGFWYRHSAAGDGFHSECKECKKAREKTYEHKPKGRPNELLLVNYLLRRGVHSDIGANFKNYKLADVVSWGCITIEMKYSYDPEKKFKFQFTSRQMRLNGAGVDVICLATDDGEETMYYFFDGNDPAFFKGGILKNSVSYIPNASHRKNKPVLMPERMSKALDNTSIIESKRMMKIIGMTGKPLMPQPYAFSEN